MPRYGLRYFKNGKEVRLSQTSGDGRVRLQDAGKTDAYWRRKPDVLWEVYETTEGHTFESEADARAAAFNLSRTPTASSQA